MSSGHKPQRSCTETGDPICTIGMHLIADDAWFYTINPLGGYDMDEILCCEACIRLPENAAARRRMIKAGAKELA